MPVASAKAKASAAVVATEAAPVGGASEQPAAPAVGNKGLSEASAEAKRLAAAILEVLAGARGPSEAAQVLGLSLCRYYQLETRALNGLLAACEPRRRGGKHGPANELVALRHECERLRRECARQQALVRAAQRTVGLTPVAPPPASPAPAPAGSRKRRRRRPKARALKMAALLRNNEAAAVPETPTPEAAPVAAPATADA